MQERIYKNKLIMLFCFGLFILTFFDKANRSCHSEGLHFTALFEAYIEDDRVREFLEESNDAAYRDMLDRFAEAIERGLWTPRRNSVQAGLERLRASPEETQT